MTTTTAYAEIVKHERTAEGDLMVFGRATSDDLDLDRQVCDPEWLKQAMPDWFASGANVREQHSSIAAGVGTELAQEGKGWNLRSLVVDPNSARKVERGVLKGYSIGIRNPQVIKDKAAPGGRIVGGSIVEVSLVDRPANPTCTLTLAKALKPGPQVASTVDTERRLVKVEELHDRRGEPLALLQAVLKGYDLVAVRKGDQAQDVADAQQAIALVAGLIQSEAACMADGMTSEACDIDLLLQAVRALEYFIQRETQEAPVAHVELAAQTASPAPADAQKAAGASAEQLPAAGTETPTPPVEKAAEGEKQTDLTELVKAAVAEAIAPLAERLAKAEAAPAPGGPVLTRTTQEIDKAAEREKTLAQADQYKRLADQLVGDPATRQAYLNKAAALRTAATS